MTIKLKNLRFFLTVAEMGNISDAAEKLGRTPSAVSMALKQLEDGLGGALFATDRKSQLTPLGEFVRDNAGVAVRRFDRTVATMQAFASNEIGRLDIACVPSVAAHLLPDIIHRFIEDRPGIEFDLRDADTVSVETAVTRGHVEIGIAGTPRSRGVIDFEPLFRDRFVLVCASDNPLARLERAVDWSDMEDQVLIGNGASARAESATYQVLAERAPMVVHNMTSLLALIRHGFGITVLPYLSVADVGPELATLPLTESSLHHVVGIHRRANESLSPVAEAFLALVREELDTRIDPQGHLQPS